MAHVIPLFRTLWLHSLFYNYNESYYVIGTDCYALIVVTGSTALSVADANHTTIAGTDSLIMLLFSRDRYVCNQTLTSVGEFAIINSY